MSRTGFRLAGDIHNLYLSIDFPIYLLLQQASKFVMKIRSGSSFSQVVLVNGNTVRSVEFPITVYCVLVLVSSTKWKNATNKMIGSTMSLGYRRAPGIPPREI